MPDVSVSQLLKSKRAQRPRTYFQLSQRVGADGKYQFYLFLLFGLIWLVNGMILMNTSFIFQNKVFECQKFGFLTADCEKSICQLPQNQRSHYIVKQKNEFQSIATEMGQYYCENQIYIDLVSLSSYVGMFLGFIIFAYYSDKYGRRKSIIAALFVCALGNLIVSISFNISMVGVGLFLAGIGGNSSMNISYYFLNQAVSNQKRQKYGIFIQSFRPIGVILMTFGYWFMSHWRLVNIILITIPSIVCLVIGLLLIEQTPQFLLKMTNSQAIKALNRIGKINYRMKDILQEEDILSVKQAQMATKQMNQITFNVLDLFRYTSLRQLTICTSILSFICYAMFYGPVLIIKEIGFNIYISSLLIQLSDLIVYIPVYLYIENINRKTGGLVAFSITLTISIILLFIQKPQHCQMCFQSIFQFILIFIFRSSTSFYFCIFYLYVTQLFPLRVTGMGMGISAAFGSISASLSPTILGIFQRKQINYMTIYCTLSILALGIVSIQPQTKGKPLKAQVQQIQMLKKQLKGNLSVKKSFSIFSIVQNNINDEDGSFV